MSDHPENSSASAIIELSRSRQRYHDQDALLSAFIRCHGFTAKEVAVEALDWKYEQYSNSPKRAFDLEKLGYLELIQQKQCRMTGKMAHSYRITDKGLAHLRANYPNDPIIQAGSTPPVTDQASIKKNLSEMRKLLGE